VGCGRGGGLALMRMRCRASGGGVTVARLRDELGTGFTSYTLWAYRPAAPDSPYCRGAISAADLEAESAEM
jgi:hypothetical protein